MHRYPFPLGLGACKTYFTMLCASLRAGRQTRPPNAPSQHSLPPYCPRIPIFPQSSQCQLRIDAIYSACHYRRCPPCPTHHYHPHRRPRHLIAQRSAPVRTPLSPSWCTHPTQWPTTYPQTLTTGRSRAKNDGEQGAFTFTSLCVVDIFVVLEWFATRCLERAHVAALRPNAPLATTHLSLTAMACSKEDEEILKAEYLKNSKPDKAARMEIVSKVALGEKEVQVRLCMRHHVIRMTNFSRFGFRTSDRTTAAARDLSSPRLPRHSCPSPPLCRTL